MTSYHDWVANMERRGVRMDDYQCPECDMPLKTVTNSTDVDWESLAECPHCESLFLKLTKARNAGTIAKGQHND